MRTALSAFIFVCCSIIGLASGRTFGLTGGPRIGTRIAYGFGVVSLLLAAARVVWGMAS